MRRRIFRRFRSSSQPKSSKRTSVPKQKQKSAQNWCKNTPSWSRNLSTCASAGRNWIRPRTECIVCGLCIPVQAEHGLRSKLNTESIVLSRRVAHVFQVNSRRFKNTFLNLYPTVFVIWKNALDCRSCLYMQNMLAGCDSRLFILFSNCEVYLDFFNIIFINNINEVLFLLEWICFDRLKFKLMSCEE